MSDQRMALAKVVVFGIFIDDGRLLLYPSSLSSPPSQLFPALSPSSASAKRIGSMRVQIEVLDANDNHPEFIQPRYSARIGPNTAPGIPILRVGAKDTDAGKNGRVEYGIISQSIADHQLIPSVPSAPFQLDVLTGTLSLGQQLPMLSHSITFDLLITARDHDVPNALESITTVEVFVDGKNTSNAVSLSVIWLTDDGTGENVPEGFPLVTFWHALPSNGGPC